MDIVHDNILQYGFVITALFDAMYPTGTTLAQMELDAEQHGWIRSILPSLTIIQSVSGYVDVSEVGM